MSVTDQKIKETETRKPRWKRRPGARPVEIAEAALEIFADRGYDATTMDEVAEKAGVSKGTIYLYYPGKEDLLIASIENRVRANQLEVLPIMQMAIAGSDKKLTKKKVREILTSAVNKILELLSRKESQQAFKVIMSERSRNKRLREKQAELVKIAFTALTGFLTRARDDGVIKCPDPLAIAKTIIGINFAVVFMDEIIEPGKSDSIKPGDPSAVLDFAFRGLGL